MMSKVTFLRLCYLVISFLMLIPTYHLDIPTPIISKMAAPNLNINAMGNLRIRFRKTKSMNNITFLTQCNQRKSYMMHMHAYHEGNPL